MYSGSKRYAPTKGVDLKSSDILRTSDFLSGGQNVRYDDQHNLVKRPGTQLRNTNSLASSGLYSFETTDLLGVKKKELLWLGDIPYRVVPTTITIKNEDAAKALYIFVGKRVGGSYIVELTRNSSVLLSYSVATSGPDTMADLVADIDSLANVTCSSQATSYDTTHYPISLDLQVDEVIPPLATRTFTWHYLQAVNTATSESFGNATIDRVRTNSDYAINSAVTINNVLYVAFGNKTSAYNPVRQYTNESGIAKYDGQTYYKAGLPRPNALNVDSVAAGNKTDVIGKRNLAAQPATYKDWKYHVQFIQIDKAGNVIESPINDNTGGLNGYDAADVARTLNFALGPDLQRYNRLNDGGYNNHFAFSSSAMAGASLTIPCDNGAGGAHTLVAGDIAFFWDVVKSKCIARKVESATASQIVISTTGIDIGDAGGNVQLLDNALISNNLRIAVWRTKSTSATDNYYLVGEFPIQAKTEDYSTQVILYDQFEDTQLGALMVEPDKLGGLPPFGSTLSSFGDTLIVSGATKDPSIVYFSERENVENFPEATNSISMPFNVTGHGESGGTLSIFGENAVSTVTGDLPSGNFRVESISNTIGCLSHASIKRVNESEIFFLSKKGPYRLLGGRDLAPVGIWSGGDAVPSSRLEPYFTSEYKSFDKTTGKYLYRPKFSMAVAEVIPEEKLYIICIPWTTDYAPHYNSPYPLDHAVVQDSGYPTGQTPVTTRCMSDTWVYDIGKDCWLPVWRDMDFSAGMAYHDGQLWGGTMLGSASATSLLFTVTRKKEQYNYQDYGLVAQYAITSEVLTHWESLGEPDMWKKFMWLTLSSVGTRDSATFDVDLESRANYIDTTAHTSCALDFATSPWKRVKLKSAKMNSIQFSFGNDTANESFAISGWELHIAAPFSFPGTASGGTQG